jgi:hypothetical protein
MVPCHITSADAMQPMIILNKKSCDASAHNHTQDTDRQLGMNEAEASPLTVTNVCATATRSHNHFGYFTKFMAATIIAAAHFVSSASAFTQPPNQMGVTPTSLLGTRPSFIYSVRTKNDLLSFSSRTKLFLSSNTESSGGSSKSDQNEWRAVFLGLQLYKAAYGDLKVPAKFVVPSTAPWPGM